jgi:hypothetical protein
VFLNVCAGKLFSKIQVLSFAGNALLITSVNYLFLQFHYVPPSNFNRTLVD